MRDFADKRFLHEAAPAALTVYVFAIALAVFAGMAVADWWTGGEIVTGAIDCVVAK